MSTTVLPPLARAITQAGLDWFYNTEQPVAAQLACNGPHAVLGELEWTLDPRPFGDSRNAQRSLRNGTAQPMIQLSTLYKRDLKEPLPAGAENEFLWLLTELGCNIHRTYPQRNRSALGVVLTRPMHPSLAKAVENWDFYECPTHESQTPSECRDSGTCEWGSRAKLTIYPTWPAGIDSSYRG